MAHNQQLLYLLDAAKLEFEAEIIEIQPLPDGRTGIILDRSYFYPTGGGQEFDTGALGEAQVLEVLKQDDPVQVVHVVDRPLPLGTTTGRIDAGRRQRHMQHHTAQHLLTQCFVHLYGLDTLSANINGYNPSTLDLPVTALRKEQLAQAEDLANQFIYQNRPVRAYFVTPKQLEGLPLRRAPKVNEDIRIVEIDGFDFTPCGGTHCASTGQIGVIKIVKTEKQNDRLRVHFVAGWQALQLFQFSFETVSNLAGGLSVSQAKLSASVLRQSEQLQQAQKELQSLRYEKIAWEAARLGESAEQLAGTKVTLASFSARPAGELRMLGTELAKQPGLVSVLASQEGQKLALLVACGDGAGVAARDLLSKLLAPLNGRGGGDSRLAQGGGSLEEAGEIRQWLKTALGSIL